MTYSFAQLIDLFPEAAPAARRAAKAKIKELNKSIASLSDFRDIWSNDINKINFKLQPAYIAYLDDLINRLRQGYEKEIRKYEYQLHYLDNVGKEQVKSEGIITDLQIAKAKSFPITELLSFKRGQTLCPFHDDHKPSLKYYQKDNHVYCFACSTSADSIDVYMKLNGCDFKAAVRALCV